MKRMTWDIKFRYPLMRYAEKIGGARASRKYNQSKLYIDFWKAWFDGTIELLACQSCRPYSHPNQHIETVLKRIRIDVKAVSISAHASICLTPPEKNSYSGF